MCRLPFVFEPVKVPAHLLAPLAHQVVVRLQFHYLATYRVESEAVPIQHLGKLGMRGDHGSAEGADRALLLE